jgi:hypothetical protein
VQSEIRSLILWPAIIHHAGQAELIYIKDELQWLAHVQAPQHFHAQDRLIDSTGHIYSLANGNPKLTDRVVNLDELLNLIRAHAAEAGQCCVAKFSAASIPQAIRTLGGMMDEGHDLQGPGR